MKTDRYQDNLDEVFKEIKNDKLDWDFEDFLKDAKKSENGKTEVVPIQNLKTKPKYSVLYWLAAAVALFAGIAFLINQQNNSRIEEQQKIVQEEIEKQKTDFLAENTVVAVQDSVTVQSDSAKTTKDSVTAVEQIDEVEIMDRILPKRGRMKKPVRERYVAAEPKPETPTEISDSEYQESYVVINGQKIKDETDAINVTRYSFQMLSNKVAETVASTQVLENLENDYHP